MRFHIGHVAELVYKETRTLRGTEGVTTLGLHMLLLGAFAYSPKAPTVVMFVCLSICHPRISGRPLDGIP
jgi:hypothetical protein